MDTLIAQSRRELRRWMLMGLADVWGSVAIGLFIGLLILDESFELTLTAAVAGLIWAVKEDWRMRNRAIAAWGSTTPRDNFAPTLYHSIQESANRLSIETRFIRPRKIGELPAGMSAYPACIPATQPYIMQIHTRPGARRTVLMVDETLLSLADTTINNAVPEQQRAMAYEELHGIVACQVARFTSKWLGPWSQYWSVPEHWARCLPTIVLILSICQQNWIVGLLTIAAFNAYLAARTILRLTTFLLFRKREWGLNGLKSGKNGKSRLIQKSLLVTTLAVLAYYGFLTLTPFVFYLTWPWLRELTSKKVSRESELLYDQLAVASGASAVGISRYLMRYAPETRPALVGFMERSVGLYDPNPEVRDRVNRLMKLHRRSGARRSRPSSSLAA